MISTTVSFVMGAASVRRAVGAKGARPRGAFAEAIEALLDPTAGL